MTHDPSTLSDEELRREYETVRHNQAQIVDYRIAQTPQFMAETSRLFELEAELKRRGGLQWRV